MPVLHTPIVNEEEVACIGGGDVKALHHVLDGLEGAVDQGLALS